MPSVVSQINWGTGKENILLFDYPFDSPRNYRRKRQGASRVRIPGEGYDAWVFGQDYMLEADVRWLSIAKFSDPLGVQAFLDWATAHSTHTFDFIPDSSVPAFSIPGCYLAEPFDSPNLGLETSGDQIVHIVIGNPTYNLGQALRGIMFEYAPGASLTDPVAATFTRATAATRRGLPGSLASAIGASELSNVLRDRHYDGTLRTTLLEAARTQLVADPENFNNWSLSGTPLRTGGQADPFGGTAAYLIEDDDGAANEFIFQVLTFTGDGLKSVAVFVRPGTNNLSQVVINDTTVGQERLRASITWTAGVPAVTMVTGVQLSAPENWGAGWYRFLLQTTSVTAANTHNLQLRPTQGTASQTGSAYFFGANAWNEVYPGSYQGPSIASRPYDRLVYPFTYLPQGIAIYAKVIERGLRLGIGNGVNNTVIVQLGDNPNRITLEGSVSGTYGCSRFFAAGNGASSTPAGTDGQVVELLGIFRPTGTVQIKKSLDGAAEVAGTESGGVALPASLGSLLLHIGSISGASNGGFVPLAKLKIMPYSFAGVNRDTIVKAAAA